MPFVNIRIYEGFGKDNLNAIASRVTDWYVGGKPGERMRK